VFSKTNPLYEEETTPLLGEGGPSQSPKVKNKKEEYLGRLIKLQTELREAEIKKDKNEIQAIRLKLKNLGKKTSIKINDN
jgi:hypothetical protein